MVNIPKEDFLNYDAKFTSRSGKDWLLLGSIGSVFLQKGLQGTLLRGICVKNKFPSINSRRVGHQCFIHYRIAV